MIPGSHNIEQTMLKSRIQSRLSVGYLLVSKPWLQVQPAAEKKCLKIDVAEN